MGDGRIGGRMEVVQKHVVVENKQEQERVQKQHQGMVVKVVKVNHNDKQTVTYNHVKVKWFVHLTFDNNLST